MDKRSIALGGERRIISNTRSADGCSRDRRKLLGSGKVVRARSPGLDTTSMEVERMLPVARATAATRMALAAIVCAGALNAQYVLGGSSTATRLVGSDTAVFEAGESRKDLDCEVLPLKTVLGFDLRFHTGYAVSVPMRELAGNENLLNILFRVTALSRPDEPLYFAQRLRVPKIEEDAKGEAMIEGGFDLGEGKYKVEWLMRDRAERVCSHFWEVEAALPPRDKQLALDLPAGEIRAMQPEQFTAEPPMVRLREERPLAVKLLVNFAPQHPRSVMLRPQDTSALVQILRALSREPRIEKFSLVAFNIQERRVIYRQELADSIDFPALGKAMQSIQPGTVDLKRLSNKNGDTEFLSELIRKEMSGADHPDAIVFAGPKVWLEEDVPEESLKECEIESPVFYMNYNLYPQAMPWRDSISRTIRYFKGTEYTISRPRDLWFSVNEMVSRIVKSKSGKLAAVPAVNSQ